MKNPKTVRRAPRSTVSVEPISKAADSSLAQPKTNARRQVAEMHKDLSKNLHELLNSLWSAAVRIELAISEKTCPPKFRKTLKQLERCVEESMSIAARVSERVDLPTNEPSVAIRSRRRKSTPK